MARSDWHRPDLTPLSEGYRRIMMVVSYDGMAFHGWQSQNNGLSVQQHLEESLAPILGEKVVVQGSGRTDRGVHALGQVCHFDTTNQSIPGTKFKDALNSRIMKSVRILSSTEVNGSFHARFTTMAREYRYFVKARDDMRPFDVGHITSVPELPSLEVLNCYARYIFGTHDFTTFASSRDDCPSKMRDIYYSAWSEEKDIFLLPVLVYTVVGNAFLYHQVRSMVGTMLSLAQRGEKGEVFRDILASKDRSRALRTAPSDGLFLARISYDEDEYRWFEEGSWKTQD